MIKTIKENIPKNKECHILIDCGAFLIPYLKYNLVIWNKVNITPLVKILELFFNTTAINPNAKFYLFIDNGIPRNVSLIDAKYKKNRKHSIHRREDNIVSPKISNIHPYSVNRTLIQSIFTNLGTGVYFFSEADYQLGYVLNKLNTFGIDRSNCFIFSHDNDLISLLEFANVFHRIKKDNTFQVIFYPVGRYDHIVTNLRIESYEEYIIMKALLGDKIDNIMPPMLITKRFVTTLFNHYKHEYGCLVLNKDKVHQIITEKALNKYKNSSQFDKFVEKVINEFDKNYNIFNIYNCNWVFNQVEKRYIDTVFDTQIHNKIKINHDKVKQTLMIVSKTYYEIFLKWLNFMEKKTLSSCG